MIAYDLNKSQLKSHGVTNHAELRFKAWTKKDLYESLNLSLKLGTHLERFLLQRDKTGVCGLTHYGYALAKMHNHVGLKPSKASRFDVLRSPFVFKKTREQFGLTQHVCVIKLYLNPQQQAHLQSQLSMLRLPGECTCVFIN